MERNEDLNHLMEERLEEDGISGTFDLYGEEDGVRPLSTTRFPAPTRSRRRSDSRRSKRRFPARSSGRVPGRASPEP